MNNNHVQVLIYTSYLHIIGGIETFMINFLDLISDSYDVGVYCPRLPDEMANRISKRVKLFKSQDFITCDTLIMVRMMDPIPRNIMYDKSLRMCHACKSNPTWKIRDDCDKVIHVSKASKLSFDSKGEVIYNPLHKSSKKALFFVSATRIPALDKGKNAERMLTLAKMLNDANIPFLWFNFSDAPLQNAPKGFVNVGTFQDLQPYIEKADYLVQLSDQEGFGYSVLEGLINKTAVLCTPFETTKELKVVDGKNGYIIPFDMDFDVSKLLDVPEFDYSWNNDSIKKKWKKLLDAKPKNKVSGEDKVIVKVVTSYKDVELDKRLVVGQILPMTRARAEYVATFGYIKIVGG